MIDSLETLTTAQLDHVTGGDGYCSPSVGCAGNDAKGNPIRPHSTAPDTSTLRDRASCFGGLAVAAVAPGLLPAIGAGFTLLGCSNA